MAAAILGMAPLRLTYLKKWPYPSSTRFEDAGDT